MGEMIDINNYRRPKTPPAGDTAIGSGDGGQGGGGMSDIEARVRRLEDDGKELRADLKIIMRDLSEVKGRVNAMPTTWQMVGFTTALFVALFGFIRFGLGLGG